MLGEKKQLMVTRDLYTDPTFPASDTSIFFDYCTPLAQFRGEISWLRPKDICSSPRLFSNNLQDVQVKQGILGDCWFLCACVALQKSKYLLNKVIPPGQPSWTDESYQGCFTCRVWQFGHWVEVTIDDRLPCLGGKLCFSQCQTEDLFWLPLLEKAYAKYVNIAIDGNRSAILVYFFAYLLYLAALGIDLSVVTPGGPILACAEIALETVDL